MLTSCFKKDLHHRADYLLCDDGGGHDGGGDGDDDVVHLGPHELVLLLDLLDHLLLQAGQVACLQDQVDATMLYHNVDRDDVDFICVSSSPLQITDADGIA